MKMSVHRTVVVGMIAVAGVVVGFNGSTTAADRTTGAARTTAPSGAPLPPKQRARLGAAVRAALRIAATLGAVVAVQTPRGRWVRAFGIADTRALIPDLGARRP
jgi:uncharacterized membrane protein